MVRLRGAAMSAVAFLLLANVGLGSEPDLAAIQKKGAAFLRLTQNPDGSWSQRNQVGITGLVTTSLLKSGVAADDPMIVSALKYLSTHRKPDGGFYSTDSRHRNYETCLTLLALAAANQDGKYNDQIGKAKDFLKELQWDQGEGLESSDPRWGGAGYGGSERPDMSNTQFLLEALKAANVEDDDPALQKILIFVSRTQNLESPANDTPFAGKINDGGFYYTPAAGGDSKAGTTENGGLRSYGSMTYAGLKSFVYAGLSKDDQRVTAATDWIRQNYTLAENPGMGQQGLYYYFHTFGRTMDILGVDSFVDAEGKSHNWKQELLERVASLQTPNGSWINPADRWYEGDPNLVTAYCLTAISYCR